MNLILKKLRNATLLFAFGISSSLTLNAQSANHPHSQNVLYGEWPILGVDYSNTQVNKEERTINRRNVGTLVDGWNLALVGPGVTSQPTYADGKIYFADSLGTLYAADATTGTIIWQTNLPNNCYFTSPTLTDNIVYIASTSSLVAPQNSNALAFSRITGKLLWSTPLYQPGQYTGEYPGNVTAVDDLLIIPVSSFFFDGRFQGRIMAFNRLSGVPVWTVATTSDQFLPNPQFGPGSGSFSAGAVDTEQKLYFIGTGQTFSGVEGPLTDSLLAINYCRGELEWSYKYETNDVWTPFDATAPRPPGTFDLDVSVPPNLFSVTVDGKCIDCVGAGSKGGLYKIFKRSQPHPHNVQPLAALQLDPGSAFGTIHSTPVVHDGILYIASVAVPVPATPYRISTDTIYIPVISPVVPFRDDLYDVASMKTMALDLKELVKIGYTDGTIPQRAVRWTVFSKGAQGRNPIIYANGVLYQTSQTGFLRALDPRNGAELFYTIVDPQILPTPPGILTAGATVVNGRVYMAYGYDPVGLGGVAGGIKTYELP